MEQEFIPYEQALALKKLGFDEPCFGYYIDNKFEFFADVRSCNTNSEFGFYPTAPTYSQAFKWFREKYGLYHSIGLDDSLENNINCDYQIINHSQSISELETSFKSYEEAELACLIKLIEIVKKNDTHRIKTEN
jgi:hypothetical protein